MLYFHRNSYLDLCCFHQNVWLDSFFPPIVTNILITIGSTSSYHLTFGNIFSCSFIEIMSICFDNALLIVYAVLLRNVGDHGASQFLVPCITHYSFSFLISLLIFVLPILYTNSLGRGYALIFSVRLGFNISCEC